MLPAGTKWLGRKAFVLARINLLFLFFPVFAFPQSSWSVKKLNLTSAQGLSQNYSHCAVEDQNGFLWIATKDGLNRFDGYQCKVFRNELGNSYSLLSNNIKWLTVDHVNRLWVTTFDTDQLHLYRPESDDFKRFEVVIDGNRIHIDKLWEAKDHRLWLTDHDGRLLLFDPETGTAEIRFQQSDLTDIHKPEGVILELFSAESNRIWVSANLGLLALLDAEGNLVNTTLQFPDTSFPNGTPIPYKEVRFLADENGRCYLHTYGFDRVNRIHPFDEKKQIVAPPTIEKLGITWRPQMDLSGRIWVFDPDEPSQYCIDPQTWNMDRVSDPSTPVAGTWLLTRDHTGLIWGNNGLNMYAFDPGQKFHLISHLSSPPSKLNLTSLRSVREAPGFPGAYWISGYVGLELVDLEKGPVTLSGEPARNTQFSNMSPWVTLPYGLDSVLMGDVINGLVWYNIRSGKMSDIFPPEPELPDPRIRRVKSLLQMKDGRIIFGSMSGIYQFHPRKGSWTCLYGRPDEPGWDGMIEALAEGPDGSLWAGGDSRLFEIEPNGKVNIYPIQQDEHIEIKCLHFSEPGQLWAGTSGKGLLKFNFRELNDRGDSNPLYQQRYTTTDGLPNDVVYGILEDKQGNLWMSTNKGLSRFDPLMQSFRNFNQDYGIQNDEFNSSAWYQDSQGRMFFGGIAGLTWFFPEEVTAQLPSYIPLTITGIQVNGKAIPVKPGIQNGESSLNLSPQQNVVKIEFALMDHLKANQHRYAYRISEIDTAWIDLGLEHSLTFRNLSPGDYSIQLKGTDRFGDWHEKKSIIYLSIEPHWFETFWFRMFLGLAAILLIVLSFRLRILWLKRQRDNLQREVDVQTLDLKAQKKEIERALEQKEVLLKEIHHRVKNNLQLISSLLDLQVGTISDQEAVSALEEGKARVQAIALIHARLYQTDTMVTVQIDEYLEDLCRYFQSLPVNGHTVQFVRNTSHLEFDIDTSVPLGLILNELITNSYKHAFPNRADPMIRIGIQEIDKGFYELCYQDNGIGLPEDINLRKSKSLGYRMIRTLVSQLLGKLSYEKDDFGSRFTIQFRDTETRKALLE